MRVEQLDVPNGVPEILRGQGITELYPPQEAALPAALAGKNVLLAVPTASGKSLVAYLAALKQVLDRGGKALYIVPLRALAAEKFDDLKAFEPLGVRVGVSVGDLDSPDPELERYDIIIATSEKADSLLRHRSHWLQKISLVVADEVHLIHDPERGPTLEVTLTKFRKFNPSLQVIALSATVKNSKELAQWLDAKHFTSEWRPTPLKEGVYTNGVIRFTDNSTREVEVQDDPAWSLVRDSLKEGGQCLIFVNTRRSTEALATKIAPRMREVVAERVDIEGVESLDEDDGEPTTIGRRLKACIRKGVAFHNAGLSNEQRRFVESGFKKGLIKVIVATPTLAAGINLPARRVIVRDVFRYEGSVGNVAIPVMEIKQMCGRAGRPRYDPFGEAILLAKDEDEAQFLFENYLLADTEEIYSKLGSEAVLRSHILATVATATATSKEGLMEFFDSTFFAHQTDTIGLEETVDQVLEFLEREEMVRSDGFLQATFFGRRTSDLYIDPLSAVKLRDALRAYRVEKPTVLGFLHAICATPDMLTMYLRRTDYDWLEALVLERGQDLLLSMSDDLEQYDFFLSELKTASVLEDWMSEMDEDAVLKKYTIGPGDLHNKVEIGEWLLYSMRELANIFNKDAYPPLTELMTRVRYGVRRELLDLVKLRGVGRARARSLFQHGLRTIDDIRAVDPAVLAHIPKIGTTLAKSIKDQLGKRRAHLAAPPTEEHLAEPKEARAEPAQTKKEEKERQKSLLDF